MSAAQAARTHFPHFTTECCEHWSTVTICGSMRFYYEMLTVAEELTLDGLIVLMPFVRKEPFMEADVNHPGNVIEKLDAQHKRKIDLATSIVVVSDDSGYYGDSTRSEIDYAQSHCKTITYRRVALKHVCAGHPSDVCTACRAAKQAGEPDVDRFLGRRQRGQAPATRRGKAGMIDLFFRFLELRYAGEIRELTRKVIASPIDECNRPRAVCRTLVVTGHKVRTWGFWCAPDRFVPWDQFDGGCGEEQS